MDATITIERRLQDGNRMHTHRLLEIYSSARIAAWLSRNGPEGRPEPHFTFWKFLLGV